MRYPEEFFKFYKEKLIYPKAKPNAAHIALAKLEKMCKLKTVVTQNIDCLHQAAKLIDYFRCKNLILINKSSTSADNKSDLVIHDAIGKILDGTVNNLQK